MPNWVQTNYVFKGDTEDISKLIMAIEQYADDCGESWLCDIIEHFGGNTNEIQCRGYVAEYNPLNPCTLELKILTAYFPLHETWDFVRTKLPSISYQFIEIV